MTHPPYAPPAHAQPKNGLGTAGFVLGLVGLVFAFIPLVGVVAWPLVIIGLILSIVGVSRATKGAATNKGLAIAGVVCSAVGLVICILWTAVFGAAVDKVNDSTPTSGDPAAAAHQILLEVTTGQRSNLNWTSGLSVNNQEIVEAGQTWSKTLGVEELGFTSVTVTPVTTDVNARPNSCKITVDGKPVAENSNLVAAICSYTGH
ncbi:DUF4190 domain-containing protein [Amycolatopsis methanolica]|uniref:DUF4190 domain-containing protein n=1 Tax=Amycolatopsis methanolica TaxID=1814 RepID=UPI0034297591